MEYLTSSPSAFIMPITIPGFPPGSTPARMKDMRWVWTIAKDIELDYDHGDFVHIWDNRHLRNACLHTSDDLVNKVGQIWKRCSDNSYWLRLVGEVDIARNIYRPDETGGDHKSVRMFPERFKRIYRDMINVQDITDATHALGDFMQRVDVHVQ